MVEKALRIYTVKNTSPKEAQMGETDEEVDTLFYVETLIYGRFSPLNLSEVFLLVMESMGVKTEVLVPKAKIFLLMCRLAHWLKILKRGR